MTRSLRGDARRDNPPAGGVDVWHIDLAVGPDALAALAATLSAEEQARADRFRFDRDRHRFIAGRGMLRTFLGRYTGLEPATLSLGLGPTGKPYLSRTTGGDGLFFNLAHSEDHAMLAVTCVAEVGIDIEVIRPVRDMEAIARRCFSEDERDTLAGVAPDERDVAFFTAWTRKEAFVKADGAGLSYPLQEFSVTLSAGKPARIVRARPEAESWSLTDLSNLPAYAAALVVCGRDGLPVRVCNDLQTR